jgi:hypothetical protein
MGNDLDGDGRVDRWDRDEEYRRQQEERRAEQAAQDDAEDIEGAVDEEDEDAI